MLYWKTFLPKEYSKDIGNYEGQTDIKRESLCISATSDGDILWHIRNNSTDHHGKFTAKSGDPHQYALRRGQGDGFT